MVLACLLELRMHKLHRHLLVRLHFQTGLVVFTNLQNRKRCLLRSNLVENPAAIKNRSATSQPALHADSQQHPDLLFDANSYKVILNVVFEGVV